MERDEVIRWLLEGVPGPSGSIEIRTGRLPPAAYPGAVYFQMEQTGNVSRWNTLRAMRVLEYYRRGGLPSRKKKLEGRIPVSKEKKRAEDTL